MITDINILTTFEDWKDAIKDEYIKNGKLQSKRFVYNAVKRIFPKFIDLIEELEVKEYFREILYCILNDIEYVSKCPICNKPLPLKNFVDGFHKTCSKKCASILFSNTSEIGNKISNTRKTTFLNKQLADPTSIYNKYDLELNHNYYNIRNYCKHGDVAVYVKTFKNIESIKESSFCLKCNEDAYNNYCPSDADILDFQNRFKEFYNKHHHSLKYSWWITYYPKQFKILKVYYERYIGIFNEQNADILAESYYVFLHKLKSRPKCKIEHCNNCTHFSRSILNYTIFCDSHMVGYNNSGKELELEDFIKSLNVKYKHNDRTLIGKELDFYFPEKNIAIEFNGTWFHSNQFKDNDYHKNKYDLCRNKGVQLIYIWEDDWAYKKDIVKSIIKNKLGLSEIKIGARKTEIKEVSVQDSRVFLDENHMQGYCNSNYRYGLYFNGELVELMTFGKSRFKKGEFELLRLCTKANYEVIGGAAKLFRHFLKVIDNNTEIISYANCDISNGSIYRKLGFDYIHTTDSWSWFYKGKRINRFNNIRKKEKELNLPKCYSAGTMKFIYRFNH